MKTIFPFVLLITGAGLMQGAITQSITIDLSALHAGSTLSGTFTLSDTPKADDTAQALLSFSDPSDYSPTSLTATITIEDGTGLRFAVRFSDLSFINPTGNRFTTNVNLRVAGVAQCASFPCTATGRFEAGSPAAFASTYSIAPAAAVPAPAPTPGGNIWGVSAQNAILFSDGTQWQTVTGTMKQVSVAADGTVVAVDPIGNVFSWTGSGWKKMPGSPGNMVQISAGAAKNIWGVDAQNKVPRWDGNSWAQMPGTMQQVSVAADGSTWAVDAGGNISFWTGAAWQGIPGALTQISAGAAKNVWGVNSANNIWRWDGTQWQQVPGAMAQVAVAQDGNVVALDLNGNLFRWTGTLWAPLAGSNGPLAQISTGINGRIEDNNAALTYKGAWTKKADAAASGGAYAVSSTAGDTLTYAFTGDSLTIFRYLDANGGQADVTIDGKPWGTVSFYFPATKYQIPAAFDHLGAGPHALVLKVSATRPTDSKGTNVTIDAVSAPAPFAPTAEQSVALDRFNYYRALAKLPPASLSMAINLAAQAHADYNATTGVLGHVETPATPGFVGVGFGDRTQYFGYDQSNGEIAFGGADAAGSVDGWMSTVYHRNPILGYTNTDIGYGISRLKGNLMTVADFGLKSATPPPAARALATYPIDGQVDVPNSWDGGESPDPLPGKPKPVGYPISLHIAQPANAPVVTSTTPNILELFDSNNRPVPLYSLDRKTDANNSLDGNTFFIIPQQPLNVGSTYRAHMKGTDGAGNGFDVTWSFTTLQATAISGVLIIKVGSDDAWIQWSTAGPVAKTFVDYGPTTDYGSQAQVNNPCGTNCYVAHLTGLTPNATHHFRVTAQDAAGKTATSGDFTIVTTPAPPPPPATAISDVLIFDVGSDNAWIQWSTGGALPKEQTWVDIGTTTNYGTKVQVNNLFGVAYVAHPTGLSPKTTYHFRVTAQDAGITGTSGDFTFVTLP